MGQLLTVITEELTKLPSPRKRGTCCILPIATIATSGTLMMGEPNLPPIAPKLETVIVPPEISSVASMFLPASWISRDSSVAICERKTRVKNGMISKPQKQQKHSTYNTCEPTMIRNQKQGSLNTLEMNSPRAQLNIKAWMMLELTSSTDMRWTFFTFGTTSPKLVAIATPMLCEAAREHAHS